MKKCLVVIDAQKAMFSSENKIYLQNETISNINKLITKFRKEQDEICFVLHESLTDPMFNIESDFFKLDDSISYTNEKLIIKKTPNSFLETELLDFISEKFIDELYIVGFQTDYCIDTTVKHAHYLGLSVNLVSDAHSTKDQSYLDAKFIIDHHNNILSEFSNIISTNTILK